MTKSIESINLSELIDLLVYHTEHYLHLSSKMASQAEMEACNDMLCVLLKEYETRQAHLSNYN